MFSPVLIHVPHSSVNIPPKYRQTFLADIETELGFMTDWYTDELLSCRHESLIFPVSRLVCDVERFRDDSEEVMSARGMGAVYENCHDLKPLRKLQPGEREKKLSEWYDPHHRRLEEAVGARLAAFSRCLIIDAHSFYHEPLPYELDREKDRPDFCVGTDGYHTPAGMGERLAERLRELGYTAKLNSPFSGSIVPLKYYGRDKRVASIMLEINRGLYLDGIEKSPGFGKVKSAAMDFIEQAFAYMP